MSIPSTHASLLFDLRGSDRREAWSAFDARYRGTILAWCARRGLSRADAEDLTQDVLLKLFQRLPSYHHDPTRGQFRDWLKTVVSNALTDFWRRRRPECDAVGGTAFWAQVTAAVSPEAADELSTAIGDRGAAAEVFERVRAKLKETTWEAFYQALVENRPAAEVAAMLNLSVTTVYKATYRVKKMLLEEHGYEHPSSPQPVPAAGGSRGTPA